MEARSAIHGTAISKSLVAIVAVSVTLGLGVTAGVVAKTLSGTAATQSHISQGLGGAAFENPARRNGMQLGDYAAPAAAKAVGPDDRPSNTQFAAPAAPAASTKLARGTRYL